MSPRLLSALVLILSALHTGQAQPADKDLDRLSRFMTGSFNSAEQAATDTAYFDISLHMTPIWTHRTDGKWLYVEQALSSNQAKPYRQRVYCLTRTGKRSFKSAVYELKNPAQFAGAWNNPAAFNGLLPSDLEPREGCEVLLKKENRKTFRGATTVGDCQSSLRGAKYATSKVTIQDGLIESWDQGFDAAGKQVWGAVNGGYIFNRVD